jgi:hypothetical protein
MNGLLLTAMLLCQQAPGVPAEPPTPTPSTPGWSVEYRWIDEPGRGSGKRRLWVGLGNDSADTRAVCITAVWYSLEDPRPLGVNRGGTAVGMGTHSCRDLVQFHLLTPSQAHYVLGEIEMPEYSGTYSMSLAVHAETLDPIGNGRVEVKAKSTTTTVTIPQEE